MTKPITIDEMLETLRKLDLLWHGTMLSSDREVSRRVQAIRAILEKWKQLQNPPFPDKTCPECGSGFTEQQWKDRFQ